MNRTILQASQLIAFALLSGCLGCSAPTDPQPQPEDSPPSSPSSPSPETAVRELALPAPCDAREVEFSGMAWHGDVLVLLPQYPASWRDGPPAAWSVPKQAILDRLDGTASGPLPLRPLPVELAGVPDLVSDYQGFEGIAFRGDEAWLTIECDEQGYLVRARMEPNRARLVLEPDSLRSVRYPRQMKNMGFETVLATDDGALALFEANGANLGRFGEREGVWLGREGGPTSVGVAELEFRLTDATAIDSAGRFWVSNYFYASNTDLECPLDPLRPGPLPTHDLYPWVERLVELELVREGDRVHVALSGRAPLWLELADDNGRNWEGIVRLDDRGFLLVTDKYPRTIFGFVPAK